MSFFQDVAVAPPDAVFHVTTAYNNDTSPEKCNLGVGAYRTDEGNPWVLPVVRSVETALAADETLNHEYLSIDGLKSYSDAASRLLLGSGSKAVLESRVCGVQSLSGTGALRLAAEFLRRFYPQGKTVYISAPTWSNHQTIFKHAGYTDVKTYPYFHPGTKGLDFKGMADALRNADDGSIVVLHMCAHNPTGVDPSPEQWQEICAIVKAKNHFTIFDCAYQGFVTGDPDVDARAVHIFVENDVEFMAAQSFSKNFGLYNERAGNITVVTRSPDQAIAVRSQLKIIVRGMYSNPPNHGARIVASVLNNKAYEAEWRANLKTMTDRIILMREQLYSKLQQLKTPGAWNHIVDQKGMFTFTGLSPQQCDYMQETYHIYMLRSGRINMCGLTQRNLDHVAKAIDDAVRRFSSPTINGRL
ncbi:aspartate aminotransferase, cytoplasmic-like [Sycon ciliatum]|uniref:aspartate aminotransferase, cytoplasmic-like n=1 Tax=Sycon ciliatum TaxID=27933 RepID=UPI0020ABF7FA|eukprot:scpid72627/ scgid33293/ Aspartate aminotransferase, cytoplasmic; Glutamate oxaloacetate transaminase 1; Transaminase A